MSAENKPQEQKKSSKVYNFQDEKLAKQYLADSKFNNWKDAYKEYSGTGGGTDRRDFKNAWYDADYLTQRYGDVYTQRREDAIKKQYGAQGQASGDARENKRFEKQQARKTRRDIRRGKLVSKSASKPESKPDNTNGSKTDVKPGSTDAGNISSNGAGTGVVSKPKPTWTPVSANISKGTDTWTVQKGNTLGQLVSSYNNNNGANLTVQDVAKWNNIADPGLINIGQTIRFTDPNAGAKPNTGTDAGTDAGIDLNAGSNNGSSNGIDTSNGAKPNTGNDTGIKIEPPTSSSDSTNVSQASILNNIGNLSDTLVGNKLISDTLVNNKPTLDTSFVQIKYGNPITVQGQKYSPFQIGDSTYYFSSGNVYRSKTPVKKQGGLMSKPKYFQQGGTMQQDIQQQVIQLVQAAMQGDQKATQTIQQVIQAAKQGDQQAIQLAQMIQQVMEQMKGQTQVAKMGSKLEYIKSLKYAKGGKTCFSCQNGGKPLETPPVNKSLKKPIKKVEEKACGGKTKKR